MTLKALFFDIDGTLLNAKRVMSENTYTALKRCAEKGLLLCTATARPKRLVFHDFDKIPGNARDSLKEAATHITLTADEDGVAYALKEILHIL